MIKCWFYSLTIIIDCLFRNVTHSVLWQELKMVDVAFLFSCIAVQMYCLFVHGAGGLLIHLEFLPLLLTSLTCALGVMWTWFLSYSLYFSH